MLRLLVSIGVFLVRAYIICGWMLAMLADVSLKTNKQTKVIICTGVGYVFSHEMSCLEVIGSSACLFRSLSSFAVH